MIHDVKNLQVFDKRAQRTYQKQHPKFGLAESMSVESKTRRLPPKLKSPSVKIRSKALLSRDIHIQAHHLVAVLAIQPPTP